MQRAARVAIERPNISEALVTTLREMIVDGRLAPDERVNEVQLAASLGVSRTPLREALGRLAAEGSLRNSPRLGYFVRPLTLEEFREIYPIRGILDPEALRMGGLPSAARLERLDALDDKIVQAASASRIIALDDAFHLELLADCPNRVLLELIEQFMRRTRRYELALMRERKNVAATSDQHRRILGALRARKLDRACELLRQNMELGSAPIVAWLEARETRPAKKG